MAGKPKPPRPLPAGRCLSPEDQRLWQHVTGQAQPLSGRDRLHARALELLQEDRAAEQGQRPTPQKRHLTGTTPTHQPAAAPAGQRRPPAPLTHGSYDGLDRRKAERLRRGQLPIEATLDLHGLRQAEAHRRLERFLADSQAAGKRCVLVVTGKGVHKEQGGVLRANVPRWLNEAPNRARVLTFDYARQKHGGTGALYILLRRRR